MAHQHLEHGELAAGQGHRLAVPAQLPGRQVELIGAKAHHPLGGGRRTGQLDGMASQHGADPGQQLTGIEGLGQVIIGPHLQPDDTIHFVPLGGEHQHRDLVAGLAQTAADG
ncbi:hypothetical protein D3C84_455440 [compost metagenome]